MNANATSKKTKVLMVGTAKSTGGGMWTVANGYITSQLYNKKISLKYIPTFVVGSKLKRVLFAFIAYIRILWDLLIRRPKIMHVHMAEKGSVFRKGIAMLFGKIFGCKIVVHMHGAEFQSWYEALEEEKKNKVTAILNRADKIIILGEYWKPFVSTIVPIDKIVVIYNAVAQKEKMYNPDGSTLLFLGAVGQRKGAYDLVEAFSGIADKLPENIVLKFYGPDFEKKIGRVIKDSAVSSRIEYCGWLNNVQKSDVFKETICSILPSYNEGLPMTILETMAVGIPNISTRIAAIPEVVDENNGYLINPGNQEQLKQAIIAVCNSREDRIHKSDFAYNTIKKKFNIESNIKQTLFIYKELCE